ncbi:MAG: mycothiol S-conjugate amidase [Epulopiscium sp.]|jgi:LmbE family N-acetylglucosaminyl deacetylase|uniref:PIG-L family deacetylase n=1 Tax=Defluviitalea raffinosedens TaxID=1450156 RepID=A0A7C8LEV6_9FIRM|nr:PIG-L family deacetylase [Defluviitalea raffinosedens]MBZ4667578.1 LmbE family protein [Defluviitaleaceae bacterium]MDK2787613.1 mycothiol S-conjugate amidase [Candidatus Epulonipiscium sp.]KAE9634852.1 PIG-L family deacetylase [Defluviitalea raffinosedens]MBM7687010.1 LmbE family N-acetylglucosaminyl deacetylase [Defluviitalea raffinosedens]HHW66480.1 PIG-L family deacetylase [Candidatus Epulonipiscium sp.]
MSQIKRVVSVGAHSLDAEIMGGPIMLKYAKEGAHCTYVHVTQGRLEDPNATEEEKRAYLEELFNQNKRAAEKLNGDYIWLGYVSSNMPSLEEFAARMEQYFLDEKVDLVITHWRGSMHPRHINTHDAVTTAVKRLREKGSSIRLLYGENFEDLVGFIPQAYFKLEPDEVEQWFSALREYSVFCGKVNNFPYTEYYPTIGKVRQIESNNTGFTAAYMYASLIENKLW